MAQRLDVEDGKALSGSCPLRDITGVVQVARRSVHQSGKGEERRRPRFGQFAGMIEDRVEEPARRQKLVDHLWALQHALLQGLATGPGGHCQQLEVPLAEMLQIE